MTVISSKLFINQYLPFLNEVEPSLFIGSIIISIIIIIITCIILLTRKSKPTKNKSKGFDISIGLKREQNLTSSTNLLSLDNNNNSNKVLNPAVFNDFKVLKITKISHNTKLIRFEIPNGKDLGLPIGRHISVRAEIDGVKVIRAYTPTSRPDQKGYFDILIKSYEFGKMSTYLHSLEVGKSLQVRGPVGRFKYIMNQYKTMGFVSGGSGITPSLQIIRCILEGSEYKDDKTKFVLLFQNRTVEDILLKDELKLLENQFENRLSIHYYLSNSSNKDWGYNNNEHKGYIGIDDVNNYLNHDRPFVGICGPSGFTNHIQGLLKTSSRDEDSIYVF
jgi:ferredoxin-NADP reductase